MSPAVITSTIPAGTTLTYTVGYDHPTITRRHLGGQALPRPLKAPRSTRCPSRSTTATSRRRPPTPSRVPHPLHRRACGPLGVPVYTGLYCRGIVSGYLDQTFRPGAHASRVQVVKMAVLGMGWPLLHPDVPTFTDVPELSWGYEVVETALAHNAISGYADHTSARRTPSHAASLQDAGTGERLDPPRSAPTQLLATCPATRPSTIT